MQPTGLHVLANGFHPEIAGATRRKNIAQSQWAEICKKHGKAWGSLASTIEEVERHAQMGSQLLVWGVDARIILQGLTQASKEIDAAMQGHA